MTQLAYRTAAQRLGYRLVGTLAGVLHALRDRPWAEACPRAAAAADGLVATAAGYLADIGDPAAWEAGWEGVPALNEEAIQDLTQRAAQIAADPRAWEARQAAAAAARDALWAGPE